MKKYYNYHPKGFANEYTTVYVETKEEEDRLFAFYDESRRYNQNANLERVTVKELRKMASDEKWARKTNPAFSGYCSPDTPISATEFLNDRGV